MANLGVLPGWVLIVHLVVEIVLIARVLLRPHRDPAARMAWLVVLVALPMGNPALHLFFGRIDLRNHRKIVVIDNRITCAGSQNCADAAFAVKARYAPWVDTVLRLEGPIARQNQHLFLGDWMTHVDQDRRRCWQNQRRQAMGRPLPRQRSSPRRSAPGRRDAIRLRPS